MHFNFIAGDHFDIAYFKEIESFVDAFPDFQTVVLNDEEELMLLFQLMSIESLTPVLFKSADFSKYWDLSSHQLPEYNKEQFDQFYNKWIHLSGRENNMDEYGNIIFLQGLSQRWNRMKHRFVIREVNASTGYDIP